MNVSSVLFLAVLNIPIYFALGRVFFGSWRGFYKALGFFVQPDFVSALRGQHVEDQWSSLVLSFYLGLNLLLLYFQYMMLA